VTVAAGSCLAADIAAKAALLLGDAGPAWLDGRALAGRFVTHDGDVNCNDTWLRLTSAAALAA
jgi:thiamine biosynthesis lipoprotein